MFILRQLVRTNSTWKAEQALIGIFNPLANFHFSEGRVHLKMGSYQQALAHCKATLALDPANQEAFCLRGAPYDMN